MTGLLIEVVLACAAIGIVVAFIWLIFDVRDLKARQAQDREDVTRAIGALELEIERVRSIRMGPGTRP